MKPDNFMILPGFILKLIDLGISKYFEDPMEGDLLTILGTPGYMCPEVGPWANISVYDKLPLEKVDVWGWACTLLFMVIRSEEDLQQLAGCKLPQYEQFKKGGIRQLLSEMQDMREAMLLLGEEGMAVLEAAMVHSWKDRASVGELLQMPWYKQQRQAMVSAWQAAGGKQYSSPMQELLRSWQKELPV